MQLSLRYGNGLINLNLDEKHNIQVYSPSTVEIKKPLSSIINESLDRPIHSRRLDDMAKGNRDAAILIDDATRSVPNADILPLIIERLEKAGISKDHVCIISANGRHRPINEEEIKHSLGSLHGKVEFVNHNAWDKTQLKYLCRTSRGNDIHINKRFLEADLRIIIGDVEYHQFAGYGGGAKSVFPGIGDAEAIENSHAKMEEDGAYPGRIEENPVRMEIEEAGRMAGVDFAVNVVLDSEREVIAAFSGEVFESFREAAGFIDTVFRKSLDKEADAVIASAGGYPFDINLYQAQKGIESAKRIVKKGGKIMMFAECIEGVASDLCIQWMRDAKSLQDIIERNRKKFTFGGHKAYELALEILHADIYLYSSMDSRLVKDLYLKPFTDINDVNKLIADCKDVAVLPFAAETLTEVKGRKIKASFGL